MKIAIPQATKQGYIECEDGSIVDMSFPKSKSRRGRVQGGEKISPTLMAGQQDLFYIEPINSSVLCYDPQGRKNKKCKPNELAPTLRAQDHGNPPVVAGEKIRVRKLTPREYWRLMAFDDEDFDKAKAVVSDTQLYSQAGNSIVVDVLAAIFKELI